ncbi:MAG: hypothetical protein OXF26_13405 [Alphaproteobacteria bacterium]|nr:hypothetical protein [Alphaproteobacteria bacterium]MCY4231843.1 hypothetical protein [Alphaproteobacteria bacterium]MCY4320580.1 hypothetical protein [Alphaproteobacteria bacterium]
MASRAALHERIVAAEGLRAVEVGIDLRRLNEPDSPVFNRAENTAPFFGAVGAVFAALYLGGWVWALAVAGTALILMATGLQYLLMLRLRRRALAYALSNLERWQRLWDMGGLTLRLPSRNDTLTDSPDGDWAGFVARHLGRQR